MIIVIISLIFIFGYNLSGLFLPKAEKLERLSIGFISGLGLFSLFWFLLNLAGIPFNLISSISLLLLCSILLLPFRKSSSWSIEYFKKIDTSEKILLGIIVLLLVSSFIGGIYYPVRHWDSLTLYDSRARSFVATGFMNEAISRGDFFGYPLLTSLSHALVYVSGFTNPSFIYSLFYISFVSAFFVNLKKLGLTRNLTLLITLIIAVSPRIFDHSLSAYTNLPFLTYIVLGQIYLYLGFKNKNLSSFILSAFLVGLSVWTRSAEPFWASFIIIAFIFSLIYKKWPWSLIYGVVVSILMSPWNIFQNAHNSGIGSVATRLVAGEGKEVNIIELVVPVIKFDWENVVVAYWPFFALFLLTIIYKLVIKSRAWVSETVVIMNLGIILAGSILLVKFAPYWQDIPDSLTRMAMFIPPMIIFSFATLLIELKRR